MTSPPSPRDDLELLRAANSGDRASVTALLDAGVDVNARDSGGKTALHWAAANGGAATVELLVERGAAVDVQDRLGITPLFLRVQRGDVPTALWLIDRGAGARSPRPRGPSILHTALLFCFRDERCDELVQRLVALGADPHAPDPSGLTPVMLATQIGYAFPEAS